MTIDFHHYIMILIGTVLVNNIVLVKILGLCPFMGVSKKLEASIGMAGAQHSCSA
jgi:electron transport complex protein RnfA